MQKDPSRERLSELLETHLCDAEDSEEHESSLKALASRYFEYLDFERKVRIFNALSEGNRLKILNLLTFREMCVCELVAALDMTQPNITYHMKKLENAGLVKHKRQGKWVYYSLADEGRLEQLEVI
jgi:DNA-binding transcriptional ArsR family regulator